jgi:hypothetical protein
MPLSPIRYTVKSKSPGKAWHDDKQAILATTLAQNHVEFTNQPCSAAELILHRALDLFVSCSRFTAQARSERPSRAIVVVPRFLYDCSSSLKCQEFAELLLRTASVIHFGTELCVEGSMCPSPPQSRHKIGHSRNEGGQRWRKQHEG